MSFKKKELRRKFREVCLKRDKFSCVMCTIEYKTFEEAEQNLDVHHITNPKKIINGGFVLQNGISLCPDCHLKAEIFHSTGVSHPGYSPEDLYKKIGSDLEKAFAASERLIV